MPARQDAQKPPKPGRYATSSYGAAPPQPVEALIPRVANARLTQPGRIIPPRRDPTMTLDDVIGDVGLQEVLQAGAIRFHAVGDTGRPGGGERQVEVADDMALDFHPQGAGQNPAFFLHLGDVIYGPDKKNGYLDQLFRPYCSYPGKIIAIPGNHDGDPPDDLQSFW